MIWQRVIRQRTQLRRPEESDQWSFWQFGYEAVMVTDTALFRNASYHTERDTPETLDYERFTLVVEGLEAVVADLSRS